ncbi:MAG: DUF2442 domain-containing protein [Phycisphaerae bacterium]|nr:DUF2442 domain-containing protein [Phycisphaerae bacterium]
MRVTEPITAVGIVADAGELVINLTDGEVRIAWERCSDRLASATAEQRACAELSPGGYGIHWPLIDEDLSIQGLVRKAGAAPTE